MTQKQIDEMKRAAAVASEPGLIGLCEGGYPITGDECEFCGATWEDHCRRRLVQQQGKET